MNHILDDKRSPTQEPLHDRQYRPEVFTTPVTDDEDSEFTVLITYHWFEHNGRKYLSDYNYRIVWPEGFVPTMDPAALAEGVRHAIEARESGDIIFTECTDKTLTDDLT